MTFAPEHPVYDRDLAPYYGYYPMHGRFAPVFAQAETVPMDPAEEERAWREALLDRFDQLLRSERTRARAAMASAVIMGTVGGLAIFAGIAEAVRSSRPR